MGTALTEEHRALADAVDAFAQRHTDHERTRAQLDRYAAGGRPDGWEALCAQGLHALHLPEAAGGADAGLPELVVAVERLGRALLPGPYVPTVLAGAALAGADATHPATRELLTALAGGDTAALVDDDHLTAVATGDGWRIRGRSRPVPGVVGAEHLVVVARDAADPDRRVWLRVDPGAAGPDVVEPVPATDLTRSVGRLAAEAAPLDGVELAAPPPARAELAVAAVLAAEAAGIARWCLETAVAYAGTRVQFDRPIGSFQAVQHRAADLLVRVETATAAAWDAARAEAHDHAQQRLAAAHALVAALPAAVDSAQDAVGILGGIGFTWEHDAHLYWRRAIAIAGWCGDEDAAVRRLGELALDTRRDLSLVGPDELPELRAEVGAILDEVAAMEDDGVPASGWAPTRGGRRQRRLAEAGLVAPHYPRPHGRDAGPREQAAIADEFARRGLPRPSTVIGEWVLPTLLAHGSPEQIERFVLPTLRGELFWCQLFSEPEAGSDLAGLRTRARRVDGGWRLDGQKVWTSLAHEADWGICLARTDPDAPKHRGISYFLVDMRAPGVEIRPLRQATGHAEFNEVFLEDVHVDDGGLVGEPGDGWRLATTTLASERLRMGADFSHGATDLVRDAVTAGAVAAARPDALRTLGRVAAREQTAAVLNLRGAVARLEGATPDATISVQKLAATLAQRDNSRDLLRLLGPASAVADPDAAGDPVTDHLGLPAVLFGGGTPEIQRNVIARRVLGLPR